MLQTLFSIYILNVRNIEFIHFFFFLHSTCPFWRPGCLPEADVLRECFTAVISCLVSALFGEPFGDTAKVFFIKRRNWYKVFFIKRRNWQAISSNPHLSRWENRRSSEWLVTLFKLPKLSIESCYKLPKTIARSGGNLEPFCGSERSWVSYIRFIVIH